MSRVEELEGQIKALSSSELREFRAWLAEYDGGIWDDQFDADALSGGLDAIADKALKHHAEGRSTEL